MARPFAAPPSWRKSPTDEATTKAETETAKKEYTTLSKKSKLAKPPKAPTASTLADALKTVGVTPDTVPGADQTPASALKSTATEQTADVYANVPELTAEEAKELGLAEEPDDLKPPKAADVLAQIAAKVAANSTVIADANETTMPTASAATVEKERTPEELVAIADAEKAVETAKAELTAARAKLASLKHGPTVPDTDADGKPLSAGKKAWLTRLARGTAPSAKPKAAKPPIDPNAPNLSAGQKAALTRKANEAARAADTNFVPAKPVRKAATTSAQAAVRLNTALDTAFGQMIDSFDTGKRVDMSA
jgi:hypothetical protein